jgi:hypothetical protein
MIRIKGLCAVYGEVWYDERPPDDGGVDIALYRQRSTPMADGRCVPFSSLVSNLTAEGEAILAQFSKECRYEIRRADSKDGLQMDFLVEPKERLEEFCRFYESFARQKALGPLCRPWLASACDGGHLVLSAAVQSSETLVWHAYLVAGKTARLQHSTSLFRNMSSSQRALVGRANRWLHWRDMTRFKEMGMERYDWGGLFEDESSPERAGINEFKRGFGGRYERTYDCTVPLTFRGHMWLPVRDGWRELTRISRGWSSARSRDARDTRLESRTPAVLSPANGRADSSR